MVRTVKHIYKLHALHWWQRWLACFRWDTCFFPIERFGIATLTCRDGDTVLSNFFFSHALFAILDYARSLSHKMADDEHEAAAVQGYRHVVDAANPHLPFKIDLPHPFSGDGTEPFSAWIQRFEVAFNVSAVSLDKAKLLPVKLIGPAFAYWQSLPSEVKAMS